MDKTTTPLSAPLGNDEHSPVVHFTSFIVHTRPEALAHVQAELPNIAGTEVHGVSPAGKLIVALECQSLQAVTDANSKISDIAGVVMTSMVFHQVEEVDGLDRPIGEESLETANAQCEVQR